ncbi:MAG: hypothetical protein Q7U47_01325 [Paludibacter sp.]|nr:hypothetical protein [Paludibacter sp.]
MNYIDIRFQRERFDKAARFYKQKGIIPQRAIIRVVVPFVASTGSYVFNLKKDPSLAHVTENLLKRTDLLVSTRIGLALMVELDAAKGTAPIYSYPVITGTSNPTGLRGLVNTNGYAMYNGSLTMKTGQVVNISKLPTSLFLAVPRGQPALPFTGAVATVHPAFDLDNIMYPLAEEIIFAGTKEQPIQLDFPACTIAAEASCTAYAVLLIEGWLLENGTTEDSHSPENPYNGAF